MEKDARRRVETQIKVDLQLLNTGDSRRLAKDAYDFLRLPSYAVTKEKFRINKMKCMRCT
jgi:hypothetical protein